ncbi:MAG: LuxR C-terminal-related transcriptional regulator [Candidatus Dormibacteraceae bacterium]
MVVVPSSAEIGVDQKAPRLLLVDGHQLVQAALAMLLRPLLVSVVDTVASPAEAAMRIAERRFDLVVCEARSSMGGLDLLLQAAEAVSPSIPVLLLGETGEERVLIEGIKAGAAGALSKHCLEQEFLEGVRAVLGGHRVLSGYVLDHLLAGPGREFAERDKMLVRLSPTEIEVLALVGQAKPIHDIAASRGVSEKTVRNHLANIYRKLELRNRTEAMLCAARIGLVPILTF